MGSGASRLARRATDVDMAAAARLLHDFNREFAELYVAAEQRGRGVGRALMQAAIREARDHGADTMEIGVDEPDLAARRLYESMGFTNRTGGPHGPLMYLYERPL